jgi:CxxC-x17-CxxC domain-containing protein
VSFTEKTLECFECGASFTFTTEEQEFFANKGFTNEPKRCPSCREARKANRYNSTGYRAPRQMHPAVCAECGRDTEVPFEPRQDRPVYCSDCYSKVRVSARR